MFSSKTPRDLNHDPAPWLDELGVRHSRELTQHQIVADWEPRPEFDAVQTNEPNPILVAFRRGKYPAPYWAHRLRKGEVSPFARDYTVEHIEHARKVLERLSRLEQ